VGLATTRLEAQWLQAECSQEASVCQAEAPASLYTCMTSPATSAPANNRRACDRPQNAVHSVNRGRVENSSRKLRRLHRRSPCKLPALANLYKSKIIISKGYSTCTRWRQLLQSSTYFVAQSALQNSIHICAVLDTEYY